MDTTSGINMFEDHKSWTHKSASIGSIATMKDFTATPNQETIEEKYFKDSGQIRESSRSTEMEFTWRITKVEING